MTPLRLCRAIKALTADAKLTVETVILPDGEEYKSIDVLGKVPAAGWRFQQAMQLPDTLPGAPTGVG